MVIPLKVVSRGSEDGSVAQVLDIQGTSPQSASPDSYKAHLYSQHSEGRKQGPLEQAG